MYENIESPKRRNALMLGCRLRATGAIQGLISNSFHSEAFTQEESDAIRKICKEAEARARKSYEDTKRALDTTTDIGSSPESREYAGK